MKNLALLTMLVLLASSPTVLTPTRAWKGPELAMVAGADDGDNDEGQTCSTETLKGVYGVSLTGTRPAPPPSPPGTIEQAIGIDTFTFDGEGTFTVIANDKGSISGMPFPDRPGTGTYTVNPDCSATYTLNLTGVPFSIVDKIVIVKNGKEFRGIVASPLAVMISVVGQRTN